MLQPVALALIVFAVAVINCTADENWLRYERIIHARRCAQRHGQGRGQAVRCPGYIPAFFRSGTVSGARPAAPRRGRQRLDSHLSQALQRKIHLTSLKKKVHVTSALGEKPNVFFWGTKTEHIYAVITHARQKGILKKVSGQLSGAPAPPLKGRSAGALISK